MYAAAPHSTPDWIALLDEEIALLESLARAAADARNASFRDTSEVFAAKLEEQAKLCHLLQESRARRRRWLAEAGRRAEELSDVVVELAPDSERDHARSVLDRWFSAASRAQAEIDANREFYSVALAAIEEAVAVLTGTEPQGYDPKGRTVSGSARRHVSTSI